MNKRDRQIHFFLQLFTLFAGGYFLGFNIWKLATGFWQNGLFEFHLQEMPIFIVSAGIITGTMSLISSALLWMRVTLAYGFSLFTSGIMFGYTMMELSEVVFSSPMHAIPLVLILFVVMQTFPFLLRRTQRNF